MELSALMWIIIGVVILAIIAILLIVFGLRRNKQKQISFEPKQEIEKQKPSSGNYQAQSGFNFTSGGAGTATADKPEADAAGETTIGGVRINRPADSLRQPEPVEKSEPQREPAQKEQVQKAEPAAPAKPVEQPVEKPADETADKIVEKAEPVEPEQISPEQLKPAEPVKPEPAEVAPVEEAPAEEPQADVEKQEEPKDAATPTPVAPPVPAAAPETAEPEAPAPAPEQDPAADIAPVDGRMGKLRARMSKSQNVIGRGVLGILSAGDLDEDAWEEIEDTLLMADLGTPTTMAVVDDLRGRIAANGVSSEDEARAMLRAALIKACKPEMDRSIKAMPYDGKPAVIMVVGVNGTGKTTTTGKLSRVLIGMGHSVTLGAADTFRAAAADQLETWGRRVGAKTVRGAEGADPASVAFDAVAKGIEEGSDVVVIDTAGRLHNSVGLMDQLGKVKRVVEKKAKVDEVLLVLDATVGQNGLTQARVFRDVVDISGVVLTKLDGTAKGGIVFQVQEELGVPVKLVGLGEGEDHLAPFEVESFVDALLG